MNVPFMICFRINLEESNCCSLNGVNKQKTKDEKRKFLKKIIEKGVGGGGGEERDYYYYY
jgi:hypothetical protein